MSFRDLEGGGTGAGARAGGQSASSQRRTADDADSSYERDLRSLIQQMQESARACSEHLERAERGFFSKRVCENIDKHLEQCRICAQKTETLFRDWTVHLAGEPTKKHRKRFSYEKLQKAFEEELAQLKDLARRAVAAQPEFSERMGGNGSSNGQSMRSRQQEEEEEEEHRSWGIATTTMSSSANATFQSQRVAQERDEGIRRIHSQVCEVSQMMQDVASMVGEQGQHMESIEQQAEVAASSTKEAVKELRRASERQRSSREQLLCLLVAALLLFFLVILPHLRGASAATLPTA